MECRCQSTSPYGSVHPHLAVDVHSPVRVSGIEKEGYCPTAGATSPILVGRDRSFRNWSVYPDRCPRLVGPHGDQHFQWVNKLLTVYQTRHSGANIDLLQGLKTLQEMQRRAQWRAFIVVRHDEDSRLAVDYHSRSPAPRQV